uniref:Glycosyltransferase family 92 protein n=1 Tax=Meloidogyne javanica TaxID=6303 RepID=A0A915LF46_MELJA
MYLFQLFVLFLHSIPNYSTPPYPYPISLLYGWYNEAFLHRNIDVYGNKVLDWHYSEYLGDINSTNEKMFKIAIVTQTILLNETSDIYSTDLIKKRPIMLYFHYRFVSHYNLCGILELRQRLSDFLVSRGNEKYAERNLPRCDLLSPSLNRQICDSYAHVIDEMNFLMFLRRMETEEFQQIINKANLEKLEVKLYDLFGSTRTEILRYALPEFNYVFAFERSEFSELKEFYITYFDDSLLISKWRSKQYIEYSLITEDKNFDDEEKIIWSEMTKYYWYGDTEMQIQYVELKDLTGKQIAENISRYYLNVDTIVEKELHPKTPSYILATKNLKNEDEIIKNKITNIKKIVLRKIKRDNLVKNCEARKKMHADRLVKFMINKNSALEEDELEDSIKSTTNEELRKLTDESDEIVEVMDEENYNKLEVLPEENIFNEENLIGQEMVQEGKLSFNKLDHEIIAHINLNGNKNILNEDGLK